LEEELRQAINATKEQQPVAVSLEWYQDTITLEEIKQFIKANLNAATRSFVATGYYLKYIRDKELYIEAGYESIWDFAKAEFGISKSSASRFMAINDRFSKDGNSPLLMEQYKDFSSSKLSEMLTMTDDQLEQVSIGTTRAEIREMKQPAKEEIVAPAQQEMQPKEVKQEFQCFDKLIAYWCKRNMTVELYELAKSVNDEDIDVFNRYFKEKFIRDSYAPAHNTPGYEISFKTDKNGIHFDDDEKTGYSWKLLIDLVCQEAENNTPASKPANFHENEEGIKKIKAIRKELKNSKSVTESVETVPEHIEPVSETVEIVDNEPEIMNDVDETITGYEEEVDERYSFANIPRASDRHVTILAKLFVEKKEQQLIYGRSSLRFPSDDEITNMFKNYCRSAKVCIDNGIEISAGEEIIEFCRGDEDLGICLYEKFANHVRKQLDEYINNQIAEALPEDIKEADQVETVEADIIQTVPADADPVDYEKYSIQEVKDEFEKLTEYVETYRKTNETMLGRRKAKMRLDAITLLGKEIRKPPVIEEPEPVQPELPILKNNDQRAAFIDAYVTWPLWIETKETGERYYRYNLTDDASIVVKVYHAMLFDYKAHSATYEDRFSDGWGKEEYYLLKPDKHFKDCETNRSSLVDYLKEIQKRGA
jgi:hypothetical protein